MASMFLNRLSRPNQYFFLLRQLCPQSKRSNFSTSTPFYRLASTGTPMIQWHDKFLPIILRPSFWRSITPIALRKDARMARREANRGKPRNPATYFILMFLLIGSFSIHFINLRHRFTAASRRLDNKLDRLQEVLRRVQAGEDVDVEQMLGTGDPLAEQEWEEVMKRIEDEDRLWKSKERRDARKKARKAAREAAAAAAATGAAAAAAAAAESSPGSSNQFANMTEDFAPAGELASRKKRVPGFY